MGITPFSLRFRFDRYRIVARTEIMLLGEFGDLPGSKLSKLKKLLSEEFTQVNYERLLALLNFAEQLGLTEEDWEQLFDFLVPILTQKGELTCK